MKHMTKHGFLEMIKSSKAPQTTQESTTTATTTEQKSKTKNNSDAPSKWDALKDDYLLNSKLKDWDKEESSSEDEEKVYDGTDV
mmetsp:Transcript_29941/g.69058  ORF Transcript_29941/g.69058 Transcript_29941/m.69058 type:complete len:84 (+) Transcript_29941:141-392(+)